MGIPGRKLAAAGAAGAAAITIAACGASTRPSHPMHPLHLTQPTPAPVAHSAGDVSLRLGAQSIALPDSPVGVQVRWLLGSHPPIAAAQLQAHFAPAFLAKVGPAQLNAGLVKVFAAGAPAIDQIAFDAPRQLSATITAGAHRLSLNVAVDSRGRVALLSLTPAAALPAPPVSWSAVDARLRAVAPQVRMVAARVNGGSCETVHAIDAGTPAPLGSAFKLYVLDALGRAIAAHRLGWSSRLTVTAGVKSLPSGVLQTVPDGTRISVLATAANMISISDNTAANMLIHAVGRSAVQSNLRAAGMADPARDIPFLTTRELFILKLHDWPGLAQRYLRADRAGRLALLTHVVDRDRLPGGAEIASWTRPRDIDSLEWFASAGDICRVLASLHQLSQRPGLSNISSVMEINNAGLPLDPSRWAATWFKGGSEPGVVTLSYLATTRTGRSYVVSVLAANPRAPINQTTVIPRMLSAIQGAFTLAAR